MPTHPGMFAEIYNPARPGHLAVGGAILAELGAGRVLSHTCRAGLAFQ